MKIDLKIGGETIPLHFGMVALEEMQKLVTSYMGTNKYASDVVWAGYLNHCAIQAVVPDMLYADVMEILETHFFSEEKEVDSNLNEILAAFEKSKAGSRLFQAIDDLVDVVANGNEELKKKKRVVNHSTTSKKSRSGK
ncbi:hypothetical protein ACFSQ3_01075 [Sphingobacterium corticis]|uniref:Uncharacterized protein n=1 Tax=Sphingobacterium corticis TaxID=1812823 RepID=A0ABW5NED8_9SPHI